MSEALRHPTIEAVLAIHREVLAAHGGGDGLRSRDLLESAIAAPTATMMGIPVMSDPLEIASAYLFYLCSNHPFVDGNKRVALATCLVFLSANGLLPSESLDTDDWESLTLDVAAGLIDRSAAAVRLRGLLEGMEA
jgi:death-on-curing protein